MTTGSLTVLFEDPFWIGLFEMIGQAKADLSMAALRAVEFDFEMSQCYERKLGTGKTTKTYRERP